MFADFRVHGLNKMGDPDFLLRGTRQRQRVRLSKDRMRLAKLQIQEIRGSPSFFFPCK